MGEVNSFLLNYLLTTMKNQTQGTFSCSFEVLPKMETTFLTGAGRQTFVAHL